MNPGIIFRAPPPSNSLVDESFVSTERNALKSDSSAHDDLERLVALADALIDARNAQLRDSGDFMENRVAADEMVKSIASSPLDGWALNDSHNSMNHLPTTEYLDTIVILAIELNLEHAANLVSWVGASRGQRSAQDPMYEEWNTIENIYLSIMQGAESVTAENALATLNLSVNLLDVMSNFQHSHATHLGPQGLASARAETSTPRSRGWILLQYHVMTVNTVKAAHLATQAIIDEAIADGAAGRGPDDARIGNVFRLEDMDGWIVLNANLEPIRLGDLEITTVRQVSYTDKSELPKHLRPQLPSDEDGATTIQDFHRGHSMTEAAPGNDKRDQRAAIYEPLPGAKDTDALGQTVATLNQVRHKQVSFIQEIFQGSMGQGLIEQQRKQSGDLPLADDNEALRYMVGEVYQSSHAQASTDFQHASYEAHSSEYDTLPDDLSAPGETVADKVQADMTRLAGEMSKRAFADTIAFVSRYLDAFTVHPIHNLWEDDHYLSRAFPRSLAGQLAQDCGVYALRIAYILGTLQPELDLSFHLAVVPNHVALVIMGKDVGVWVVNNNNIEEVGADELKLWSTGSVKSSISNPLDAFIGEIEASRFIEGANMPYVIIELPGETLKSPSKIEDVHLNEVKQAKLFSANPKVQIDGQDVDLRDEYTRVSERVSSLEERLTRFETTLLPCMAQQLNQWFQSGVDRQQNNQAAVDRQVVGNEVGRALIALALNAGGGKVQDVTGLEHLNELRTRVIPEIESSCMPNGGSIDINSEIKRIEARRQAVGLSLVTNPDVIEPNVEVTKLNTITEIHPDSGMANILERQTALSGLQLITPSQP